MKRFISFMLVLMCFMPFIARSEGEYDLPLDINFKNYPPAAENFTENGYHDASLDVEIEYYYFEFINCYVARIKVKSPTQLRTATVGLPNQNAIALPSVMDKALDAVVTINGEYYVQRTRDIFIYRQGVMFRNDPDPRKDVLIIDDKGDFHIYVGPDKAEAVLAFDGTIVNAFSFGPALMMDGKRVEYRSNYYFAPSTVEWRSFIGQDGPLSYAFVLMEGGTQEQMGRFAEQLGLEQAYGLDGGNSAVMLFNHHFVGRKRADYEREQSDVIYVVTAVEP